MTFERLVPMKRAKVYATLRNVLTDLSDSASDSATSSQDKIEENFNIHSQTLFLPVALLHCTHTRLYKAVYYQ